MSIHVFDIGTELLATIQDRNGIVDLSSATTVLFFLQAPSGNVKTVAPDVVDSGTGGQLSYIVIQDDIDEVGEWTWQARVTISSGTFSTDFVPLGVEANLV